MIRSIAYLFFFFLGVILLTNCDDGLESVSEQDEFGNTITYKRRKADAARQGISETTNQIGQLIEIANYESDTLDGPRVLFFVTGDTNIVENYQNGKFDGPFRLYYEDGTLRQEGQYENNELVGSWKGYHENGQLKEIVNFENNEENGPFIEYHVNGKLAAEGSYLNGDNEHGELKVYDEQGELLRTMECKEGICRTISSAETAKE